jgi:glycosyl transferase family 87
VQLRRGAEILGGSMLQENDRPTSPGLGSKPLWLMVAAGLAIRVVLALVFRGTDHLLIEDLAATRVRDGDWHAVYEGALPWTYPPLFLGWLAGASWLSQISGISFHALAKLGPTLADVGLALAVYSYLGWRGAEERWRLTGAALVLFGPTFIATSGYHGQIDSVAILPAVLGLMAWERRPKSTRAWEAGFLIGLGAAVNLVPLLMVLPLLPWASSQREAARLVVAALGTLALALGPLWIAGIDLHRLTGYAGVPGWGGLSLVLDPGVAWHNVTVHAGSQSGLTIDLRSAARWITLGVLVAYAGFVFRYRPALIDAAVLLWLAVFTFSPNFFLTYLVWGLPFFIMAGYLLEVAILQAVLVVPTVAYYLTLWPSPSTALGIAYVPFVFALWLFLVCATIVLVARIAKRRIPDEPEAQRPLVSVSSM